MIEGEQEWARSPASKRFTAIVILLAILVFALIVRLRGLDFMLPHLPASDSVKLSTQVELMENGDPDPERRFNYGFYPQLISRVTAIAFPVPRPLPVSAPVAEHLAFAGAFYREVRWIGALLSILVVPATWLIARVFLDRRAALLASILIAASMLDLWFAQQARPHATAASFATWTVFAALNLRRRGALVASTLVADRFRLAPKGAAGAAFVDYLLVGFMATLTICTLQSGIAVLLPILVAIVLRDESARKHSWSWSLLPLGLIALGVRVFYPFLFVESHGKDAAQLGSEGGMLNLSGHIIDLGLFNGVGFKTVLAALADYEPWIFALGLLGAAIAVVRALRGKLELDRERLKDLAVVLSYALPYLLAIGLYQRTYQRFVIPLLPYLACMAAYAIASIAQALSQRLPRAREPAFVAVALLLVAPQVFAAWKLSSARSAPDTLTEAAQWITSHLEPGADRIAVLPGFTLPLAQTPGALEANRPMLDDAAFPWYRYQLQQAMGEQPEPAYDLRTMPMNDPDLRETIMKDTVAFVSGLEARYAVIEVYTGKRRPMLGGVRLALQLVGDRLVRISPDADSQSSDLPLMYQDDEYPESSPWLWRVLHARCTGPVIEIYRLKEP